MFLETFTGTLDPKDCGALGRLPECPIGNISQQITHTNPSTIIPCNVGTYWVSSFNLSYQFALNLDFNHNKEHPYG